MKKYLIFLISLLVLGLGFGVIFADYQQSLIENFDNYNDGLLSGQGGWVADPCFVVGAQYRYGPSGKGVYCNVGGEGALKSFSGRVAGSQVFYIKTTQSGADLYTQFYEDNLYPFAFRMRWNNRWSIGHPTGNGWADFGSWAPNVWYKVEVEWNANRGINGQARARIDDGAWSDWREANAPFNKINKIGLVPSTPPGYWDEFSDPSVPQFISAFADFKPDTLNLRSRGRWVTTYIELPVGYDVNQIKLGSIRLNNQISAELKPVGIGDYDNNGISDLMVKFNRSGVENILEVGEEVEITITGELADGSLFQGSDTIKVISK